MPSNSGHTPGQPSRDAGDSRYRDGSKSKRSGARGSGDGQASTSHSEDGESSARRHRVRDEIMESISIVLSENQTLTHRDFDGHVLQFLHAIHGLGTKEAVNKALVLIHASTVEKVRGQIGNWPAYIATLLKGYFADLSAQSRLNKAKSFPLEGLPPKATPAKAAITGIPAPSGAIPQAPPQPPSYAPPITFLPPVPAIPKLPFIEQSADLPPEWQVKAGSVQPIVPPCLSSTDTGGATPVHSRFGFALETCSANDAPEVQASKVEPIGESRVQSSKFGFALESKTTDYPKAASVDEWIVLRRWCPGDDSSESQLRVEVDDRVFVHRTESRGWVHGTRLGPDRNPVGPSGWFPAWVFDNWL